jgi:uncharacterized protein (TIGR00255 family)
MKSMTGFGRSSNRSPSPVAPTVAPFGAPNRARQMKSINKSVSEKKAAQNAAHSTVVAGVSLDISIKAVNGRYFDVRFHIPREYASLESEFKSLLSRTFSRGTLDVYINRSRASLAPSIGINFELAETWVQSYRALGKALKLKPKAEPTLEMLSRIPEIFQLEDRVEVTEFEKQQVLDLLNEAALACNQERAREGRALQTELAALCEKLDGLVNDAESLKAEANTELDRRLRERLEDRFPDWLKKPGFEGKVDDQRIAQEVVIYLDKADITEELTRLREHIKAYKQLLASDQSQGKKLDFYAQELLREVNTIGSKSHFAKLTSLVVDAKTLVERIREQVQNIE